MSEFEKLVLSSLNGINDKINGIENNINAMKKEFNDIKNDLNEVKNKINNLDTKVNILDSKLNTVMTQTAKNTEFNTITTIKYEKLENEIKQIKQHLKI